jgi:hypothetical protein
MSDSRRDPSGAPSAVTRPRFTADDMERAADTWRCSCGPAALAAIVGLTLDDVRPHMGEGFPGYTNPTMMRSALRSIGRPWREIDPPAWPRYGLCRIQWEGPWLQPGVPVRAAYRFTHWVGAARSEERGVGIWDVNALGNGTGWCALGDWETKLVPWLLEGVKRASGKWHVTHAIEVERPGDREMYDE